MRTSCVRPGCGGSAAAAVLIDREQQVVMLHPPELGEPGAIALCAKHVDRVTTPSGWDLRDLRVVLAPVIDPTPPPIPTVGIPQRTTARTHTNGAKNDTGLRVDDGATPLLGRAFRAASPGELRRPGEARGFAWLERGLPDGDADLEPAANGE